MKIDGIIWLRDVECQRDGKKGEAII
ncbi:hypothetical protein C5S53_12800 [Methanophagales archaeon]|nr:hypothetical protein C5S53_12800 [Methanophagales archaeon]